MAGTPIKRREESTNTQELKRKVLKKAIKRNPEKFPRKVTGMSPQRKNLRRTLKNLLRKKVQRAKRQLQSLRKRKTASLKSPKRLPKPNPKEKRELFNSYILG